MASDLPGAKGCRVAGHLCLSPPRCVLPPGHGSGRRGSGRARQALQPHPGPPRPLACSACGGRSTWDCSCSPESAGSGPAQPLRRDLLPGSYGVGEAASAGRARTGAGGGVTAWPPLAGRSEAPQAGGLVHTAALAPSGGPGKVGQAAPARRRCRPLPPGLARPRPPGAVPRGQRLPRPVRRL